MESTNIKLEIALSYARLGWSIVPIIGNAKHPCIKWKKFQTVCPTENEIRSFWEKFPGANIGVVTGAVSGIIVLDIDTKHNRTPNEFELPDTVSSRTVNLGWHFFFKHPGYEIRSSAGKIAGVGVDIRSDGGIAKLPPSEISADKKYVWVTEPTEDNIAPLPEWLELKLNGRVSSSPVTREIKNEYNLEEIPEGVRNDTLARIAGILLSQTKPSNWEGIVKPILHSLNLTNCKPPLPESEVRTIYESISRSELTKTGIRKETKPLEILTAKELKTIPFTEPQWAVTRLFENGTVNMIGAAPSNFKSWISLHIANCLTTGKPVFNEFEVTKQAVWVINEEDTKRQVQERINILNNDHEELPLYFSVKNNIVLDEDFVEQIISRCRNLKVNFIIIDSLRSVHDRDENTSKEMQPVMNFLNKIANSGITVLFTHHNRKKSGFGKINEGEEARGSSVISASSHGYISLNAKKENGADYVVISQHKQKSAKKLDPFRVSINLEASDCNQKFIHDGTEDGLSSVKVKIIGVLTSINKWLSVKDLKSQHCGGGETSIRVALDELKNEGDVVCKNGQEVRNEGLETLVDRPHHNTNFYFLSNEE